MIFDNTGRPKIPRNKWAFQTGTGGSGGSSITISYNGYNNDYVDSRYVTQAQFENFTNHIEESFYNGKTYYDDSTNTIVFDSSFTVLKDTSLASLWVTNDSFLWGKTFINNIDVSSGRIRYVNVDDISINNEYVRTSNVDNAYIQEANVNNLTVYGSAHFFNLTIDEVKAAGGQLILSAADFRIDKMGTGKSMAVTASLSMNGKYQRTGFFNVIRVYQKATDEDGKEILNKWVAGDLCYCQTFNLSKAGVYSEVDNKYYWKLVYGSGYETIDEEKYLYLDIAVSYVVPGSADENVGLGTPKIEVGDELVLLGSCNSSDRQNAIIISAYKSPDMTVKAPSIVQYKGIDDFNFTNKIYNKMSANGNTFRGDLYVESGASIDSYISGKISSEVEVDASFWKMIPTKAIAIVDKNDNFVIDLEYGVYKQEDDYTSIQATSTTSDGKTISVKYYTDVNANKIALSRPKSVYTANTTVSNYHKLSSRPKHVYVELIIGDVVIQRDTLDVVFDAGAVLDISDSITARVTSVEGQLAEIDVNADEIKAAIYDDLTETGIDIKTGVITLKADKTNIEGNRLYLWDDEAGFVIGDANKEDIRIQVLNSSLPNFPEFGGRIYCSHPDQKTPYQYTAGYEFWTDYMDLGNYLANTNIVTENNVEPYVTFEQTTSSGGGGYSQSDSYSRTFAITRYIYKVDDSGDTPKYTLKYTSSVINSSTPSNGFYMSPQFTAFTQRVEETGHYAVRWKIRCNEAASRTTDSYQRRAVFHISFYYNQTDILSKSIIAKDGFGVIKNAYNHLFYGADNNGATASRFDVKVAYPGYSEGSDYCQRIDMTGTHINLTGNVNIIKKYHNYNNAEYYGNRVYINEISLDDYDIVTISSGQYNQLKWLNVSAAYGSLCGRTKRIYVDYSTTITAPRGVTKYRVYNGSTPFTLRQAWVDGADYNDSGNTGSFLTVSAGQVYDVTMISDSLYTIVRVV